MTEVSLHVRPAGLSDLGWLKKVDHHVAPAWIERCIAHDEYLIAIRHGAPVGFMRFSWFWGTLPFMDLIWVAPEWQSKGVGMIQRMGGSGGDDLGSMARTLTYQALVNPEK